MHTVTIVRGGRIYALTREQLRAYLVLAVVAPRVHRLRPVQPSDEVHEQDDPTR